MGHKGGVGRGKWGVFWRMWIIRGGSSCHWERERERGGRMSGGAHCFQDGVEGLEGVSLVLSNERADRTDSHWNALPLTPLHPPPEETLKRSVGGAPAPAAAMRQVKTSTGAPCDSHKGLTRQVPFFWCLLPVRTRGH